VDREGGEKREIERGWKWKREKVRRGQDVREWQRERDMLML
jgi:hypothetical protein